MDDKNETEKEVDKKGRTRSSWRRKEGMQETEKEDRGINWTGRRLLIENNDFLRVLDVEGEG